MEKAIFDAMEQTRERRLSALYPYLSDEGGSLYYPTVAYREEIQQRLFPWKRQKRTASESNDRRQLSVEERITYLKKRNEQLKAEGKK